MPEKNKKINVLHLLSSLQVGGLEKLLLDLIKAGETETNDVTFTVAVMNDKVDEGLKQEFLDTKYNIYFLNRKEGHKHPKYFFQILDIIKKNKIDIIHTHTYGGKAWSMLLKIFNPKIKLVYTIHDSVIINNLSKMKLFMHNLFIDMTIAISEVIYQDCMKINILKTIKVYNGIDTKKLIVKKDKPSYTEVLNIINVSRINHVKKGQDVLAKALKTCKDKGLKFKCSLIGTIHHFTAHDRATFEYLSNLIKELGLEEEVLFLGTRHDVPELLSQADLFILPSRFEGFPISILEAMSSRLPIISSNISGSNELIKSEETGLLFESEDHAELADKILYLYNNKEKMEYLAKNAYQYVQGFDISVMHENYCNIYKNFTGREN